MKLTVLYFAGLRDLTGKHAEELDLEPSPVSVEELLASLVLRFPRLVLDGVRVAKNEEFVSITESLNDGDVVALIPPVSGG